MYYTIIDRLDPLPSGTTYVVTARALMDDQWLHYSGYGVDQFSKDCISYGNECGSPWLGYWIFSFNVNVARQHIVMSINQWDGQISDYPIKLAEIFHDPATLNVDEANIT